MIYLYASSSNNFPFTPSGSYSSGDGFLIEFIDAFSEQEFIAQATGSRYGNWIKVSLDVTSSYTINENKSKLPLPGGTYDVNVYSTDLLDIEWQNVDVNWELEDIDWDAQSVLISEYGTEPRIWSLMGQFWNSTPAIPTLIGPSLFTTKAYVSESVSRTEFSSTNENGAYIVFNG